MSVIKVETHLFGIRTWVQWYIHTSPRFEVFIYVGSDKTKGRYYFQSRRTKAIVTKGFYQLNVNGFKPFCLDWNRISKEAENFATT